MAKYEVLVRSFINDSIQEPGFIVEYEGEASDNLRLIEEPQPEQQPKKGKTE